MNDPSRDRKGAVACLSALLVLSGIERSGSERRFNPSRERERAGIASEHGVI